MSRLNALPGDRSSRLLPVLLDRLVDHKPTERSEAMLERTMTKAAFRQCVLRDLTWLLNTTNAEAETDFSAAGEVRRSVLNYGIEALSGKQLVADDLEHVQETVANAIRMFEPRILPQTLQVRVVPSDLGHATCNQLSMEIKGQLWAEPYPIELLLRSHIDLESGQIVLQDV